MSVIAIENLRYSVRRHFWSPRKKILRGVSLEVESGELFGFLGPNGAGKTTTLKALLGLLTPDDGTALVFGEPASKPHIRQRLGFMPERAYFPEHLSARELLMAHAVLAGMGLASAGQRADLALDLVGLRVAAHERLRSLSKGMQQRVGLGQALIGEPDVVILDEPMSGLDPLGRHDVRELMLRLRAAGKTVFFSTHILPDVEAICDRVAILVDGQVRRVEKLSTLMEGTEASYELLMENCSPPARQALSSTAARSEQQPLVDLYVAPNVTVANQLIDIARQHGARLASMQVQRRSLEEIFVAESRTPR